MSTEKSKTNEAHKFKLDLTDKLNLKNPNKNMTLANLSLLRLGKHQVKTTINSKLLHQPGMILLIYLMVLTQFLIFRIILNLSLKNMKL